MGFYARGLSPVTMVGDAWAAKFSGICGPFAAQARPASSFSYLLLSFLGFLSPFLHFHAYIRECLCIYKSVNYFMFFSVPFFHLPGVLCCVFFFLQNLLTDVSNHLFISVAQIRINIHRYFRTVPFPNQLSFFLHVHFLLRLHLIPYIFYPLYSSCCFRLFFSFFSSFCMRDNSDSPLSFLPQSLFADSSLSSLSLMSFIPFH